jgi:hypothetical protein
MPPLSMMPTIQMLKIYHISFTYGRIYLLAFPKNSKHKLALSLPHHMGRTAMSCPHSLFLQNFTSCCILKPTCTECNHLSDRNVFCNTYYLCMMTSLDNDFAVQEGLSDTFLHRLCYSKRECTSS